MRVNNSERRRWHTACLAAFVAAVAAAGGASYAAMDTGPATFGREQIKEDLYAAQFVNEQQAWLVGTFGSIFHTADGGTSWERQRSGTLLPLFAVDFSDDQHGWAVGKIGTILRTTDGVQTGRSVSACRASCCCAPTG